MLDKIHRGDLLAYVFAETPEWFMETEKKFNTREFIGLNAKRAATIRNANHSYPSYYCFSLLRHFYPEVVTVLHQGARSDIMFLDIF